MEKNRIYWILTIAVLISLLIPALVQDGMFLDGVTYAAISKNMANGVGSFWNPHYTKILYPNFHEHPPMVFIIQSYFFKILGNKFYTERIFSLITAILTVIGIIKCWRLFNKENDFKKYDWLPILLWITIPLVSWSYKNNLLENTMGVFTIFAVFFILKSLIESRLIYLTLGSILIVLAFLSKGFAGLFPIVVPILFAVVFKSINRNAILYSVYLFFLTISFFYIFSKVFPEIKNNLAQYCDEQLIPALNNQREITTNNRLTILVNLLIELSFPIVLLIYIITNQWYKKRTFAFIQDKKSIIFLLIAITASLPLIISLKQRNFYLIPSMPFYILSISFFVAPFSKVFLDKLSNLTLIWINRVSYITLSIVILFSILRFGKYSRDKEKLADIYSISQVIPEGTIISTTKNLSSDWGLVAYMSRIGYLSLDCYNEHEYFLMENNSTLGTNLLEKYERIDLKLTKFIILKKSTKN